MSTPLEKYIEGLRQNALAERGVRLGGAKGGVDPSDQEIYKEVIQPIGEYDIQLKDILTYGFLYPDPCFFIDQLNISKDSSVYDLIDYLTKKVELPELEREIFFGELSVFDLKDYLTKHVYPEELASVTVISDINLVESKNLIALDEIITFSDISILSLKMYGSFNFLIYSFTDSEEIISSILIKDYKFIPLNLNQFVDGFDLTLSTSQINKRFKIDQYKVTSDAYFIKTVQKVQINKVLQNFAINKNVRLFYDYPKVTLSLTQINKVFSNSKQLYDQFIFLKIFEKSQSNVLYSPKKHVESGYTYLTLPKNKASVIACQNNNYFTIIHYIFHEIFLSYKLNIQLSQTNILNNTPLLFNSLNYINKYKAFVQTSQNSNWFFSVGIFTNDLMHYERYTPTLSLNQYNRVLQFTGTTTHLYNISKSLISIKTQVINNYYNNFYFCDSVLLHFDGTNNSTVFIDEMGHSVNTASGNPIISTSLFKINNSSIYFDGLSSLIISSNDLIFGDGDFTIECWIYSLNDTLPQGIIQISTSINGYDVNYNNTISLAIGTTNYSLIAGNTSLISSQVVIPNTWIHIAIVRHLGITTQYNDSVQIQSMTDSVYYTGKNLIIGGYYDNTRYFTGYIDELRISKGIARYTSSGFTPSTTAFTKQIPYSLFEFSH